MTSLRLTLILVGIAAVVAIVVVASQRTSGESSVKIPEPDGPRIVALSPAMGIILRDLGLEELIVGRHGWDIALDRDLPVCGDQAGIDYEALLRVNPTHLVMEWGGRPLPDRLLEYADARGWSVYNRSILTLEDIAEAVQDLDATFGSGTSPLHRQFDEAMRQRETVFQGSVLILMGTNPAAVLGPGSFHQDILERIGGMPAIENGSPYMELDAEDVLRLNPDGIVLVIPRAPGQTEEMHDADLPSILGPLADLEVVAVREGRVALIDEPTALTPSTAMIVFANRLAELLATWEDEG